MPGTKHTSRRKAARRAATRPAGGRSGVSGQAGRTAHELELRELRSEIAVLRCAVQLKDQYLSVATHELSAPLAAMKAYIEALLDHYHDPGFTQAGEFLQVLGRETDRLIRLVDRTLEISRLTSRGMRVDREPTSLAETVAEILPSLRPVLEERGILLDVQLPAHLPLVSADRDLLSLTAAR
jgi:signal transduction histidine kinase